VFTAGFRRDQAIPKIANKALLFLLSDGSATYGGGMGVYE
jgi:hypothetical protein